MIISVKLTKLTKNLNYIKFSYIILDFTMLRYSNNIYCLQEGSTPFGVKVLANFGLESLKHFGVKNGRRKIDKIQKSFWIISSVNTYFFFQKCFANHILLTRAKQIFNNIHQILLSTNFISKLHTLAMSRVHFYNLYSIVVWMSRKYLLKTSVISEV